MLISNPLKELKKVYTKKVNNKNVTEKCTLFTFYSCSSICFVYNFFCVNFLTGFGISIKFCVF